MRGRKPSPLEIGRHDRSVLQEVARSETLPWYQVRRARTVLAIAEGQRTAAAASHLECDVGTVRRTCQRYRDGGVPGLLGEPQRPGRPARLSPPPARPDRRTGLPGAGGQGPAHHPLVERGSRSASCRRWYRRVDQPPNRPPHPEPGGPAATPHALLADVPPRSPVQGPCREGALVLRERRAVG